MEERASRFVKKYRGNINERKYILYFCLIFAILQLLYLFIVFPYPMANDALIYKSNALDLIIRGVAGRTQYPFLYSIIQMPGFAIAMIFGNSEVWMLIINVISKTILLIPIYNLLKQKLDKWALECTIIIAFTPIYFVWSRLLLAENLLCPLLIICLLYHIVKRPNGESGFGISKTFVAVILALSLVYTKYLSIVLLPVFCLFWASGYLKKNRYDWKKFAVMNVIYTFIATATMVLYSVYFAMASESMWTFEVFKTTIGLNSGGSSPGTVGYSLLVEPKWIICYLLYMVLGASIPIVLMVIFGDKDKLKKNISNVLFLAGISIVMCYVAARHSSLVSYNEGYKMCKLLGRYVAYFTPSCFVTLFLIAKNQFMKKRIPIAICVGLVIIFFPYLVLYKSMIWDYEPDWLEYARGLENIGFRYLGIWLCIIYCVTIGLLVYLVVKKHIKMMIICLCGVMSIHATVTVWTAQEANWYMRASSDIHSFIESRGENSVGIICNNIKKYNDMFGLNMYFADNEEEMNWHNINGVYYSANPRGIKTELEYYYVLDKEVANLQLFEEKDAEYFSKDNTEYIFLKWKEDIFEEIDKTMLIEQEDGKIVFEFLASKDCIMCFGNGFWPIEDIDDEKRRIEIAYEFEKGELYSFTIYDFEQLKKFTYDVLW